MRLAKRPRVLEACLGDLLALLGEEHGVDVGEDAARGDGDSAEQLVELLVVADRELEVTRVDPGLFVVPGCVPGELEDLGREVLEDCREVDRGAGADLHESRGGCEGARANIR